MVDVRLGARRARTLFFILRIFDWFVESYAAVYGGRNSRAVACAAVVPVTTRMHYRKSLVAILPSDSVR